MSFADIFKRGVSNQNETRDPVCGMKVNLDKTEFKSTYQGKTYSFCSQQCKDTFDKNPQEYIKA